MRIAVIGTGISGNVAAYLLRANNDDVVVYEKENRAGGHANTACITCGGQDLAVDTGFIVFNDINYPNFAACLRELGVATTETDMSFSVSDRSRQFEWSARGRTYVEALDGLFAQRSNIFSLPFYRMLRDIVRFNRQAMQDLKNGSLDNLTLREYLSKQTFSTYFLRYYLLPMGAAIWSTTTEEILGFPATNFIAFLKNHLLLQRKRQMWRTVAGGSKKYVDALTASFSDKIRFETAVKSVRRSVDHVVVHDSRGGIEIFDHVVIAVHPDQALTFLDDATKEERAILGAIRYRMNEVYVHCDVRFMPQRKAAWAAWNFMRTNVDNKVCESVTYWMNVLQDIDHSHPIYVTLNPPFAPAPELTFSRLVYEHPQFDRHAIAAQKSKNSIQGVARTWYCGAWMGYGFHEDGATTGISVAQKLMTRTTAKSSVLLRTSD